MALDVTSVDMVRLDNEASSLVNMNYTPNPSVKINDAHWAKRYLQLKSFKTEFGHCNVPWRYDDNPYLAVWVERQRAKYKIKTLSPGRIEKLEALGFSWDRFKSRWEENFSALMAFTIQFGHCNVPSTYQENPRLASWVEKQRAKFKSGALSADRIARLESVNFDWDRRANNNNAFWNEKYHALKDFVATQGHSNVTRDNEPVPKLGDWVLQQRKRYCAGSLAAPRVEMLNAIGFEWERGQKKFAAIWDRNYQALKEYAFSHGHCEVPRRYKENPQLGDWVSKQRRKQNQGNLSLEKAALLDAIGFRWMKGT